jgi:hypothetical protein
MRSIKAIQSLNLCSIQRTVLHRAGKTSRRQLLWPRSVTTMTPRKDSIPHETRTAAEPRQNKLYTVRLAHVEQINPSVRLLRLALPQEAPSDETAVRYLPLFMRLRLLTLTVRQPIPRNILLPPRTMARRPRPLHPASRRFHHNLHARRCPTTPHPRSNNHPRRNGTIIPSTG